APARSARADRRPEGRGTGALVRLQTIAPSPDRFDTRPSRSLQSRLNRRRTPREVAIAEPSDMASFGENLRRERELRGVDLREIANATKISVRFLQALEQDRVDVLPGGIFPRSFVRQYAKYLGLVPDLTAKQDCWTAVQADGAKRLDRVLKAGENVTLNAQKEIVLSVGNAGGVSFTLNGRPGVQLGREGEVRRNITFTRDSMAS